MRVFPIALEARPTFEDTWGAARSGGRTHKGTDIFAERGSPVLAVDDGQVFFGTSELGGNSARLQAADGTHYFYTHLDGFEGDERSVIAGEVIGYVGNTGNAINTPPHVHFEVHPNGGEAVNPFPLLIQVLGSGPAPEPLPAPVPLPPVLIPGETSSPPLARAAGRAAVAAEVGFWFWFWGRLLSARTRHGTRAGDGARLPTGEP